jgi:hypothetical protein
MATQFYYFKGITKWPKLKVVDEKFGKYQLPLWLDEPSWKLFHESKLQLHPKKDTDGEYVKFSCAPEVKAGNRTLTFGPIPTVDTEGNPISEMVGSGSTVIAQVEVYDTRNGKGHRLRKVTVENLIPYVTKNKIEEFHPES